MRGQGSSDYASASVAAGAPTPDRIPDPGRPHQNSVRHNGTARRGSAARAESITRFQRVGLEFVDAQELALLVENSEARAYASLIQAAPQAFLAAHGLRVVPVGSATAVVAQSVTNTVNMNRVIGLGVAEPATDAMIGQIVDIYGVQDLSFGVELAPCAQPKELPDWLRARRMRRGGTTAIQFRVAYRWPAPRPLRAKAWRKFAATFSECRRRLTA